MGQHQAELRANRKFEAISLQQQLSTNALAFWLLDGELELIGYSPSPTLADMRSIGPSGPSVIVTVLKKNA